MFGRLFGGRKSRQVAAALGGGDRFCKDCKWCRPVMRFFVFRHYEFAKCVNRKWGDVPSLSDKDRARRLVDGYLSPSKIEERYCTTMRRDDFALCGSKGVGWEPK